MTPNPPSHPPGPSDSDAESWQSDAPSTPRYSPSELSALFLGFYVVLTKLHFDPTNLKVPPPGGWPNLTRETCGSFKSDLVLEVRCCLPYLASDAHVALQVGTVDYNALGSGPSEFAYGPDGLYPGECGQDLLLDVRKGQIIEEQIRCGLVVEFDVKEWFEKMKESYRSPKLIPCLGYETLEVGYVKERPASEGEISEEEIRAQEDDTTDLDVQYIRQVYHRHGWPENFRREAKRCIDELMEFMEETEERCGWETAFH
ncbi:hypothetical protein MFIFM68171_03419 [Madurella fahalii]|uniref:Uncharacterized protein n=1 Tax=Madurella fahalii TaxID=1157608 RepID=A0ABQ0G641_9PEZI